MTKHHLHPLLVLLIALPCCAQTRDSQRHINEINGSVTAQDFSGNSLPGAIAGNLSGDTYLYTPGGGSPAVPYVCGAVAGTAAPACTSVAPGQWQVLAAHVITIPIAGSPITTGSGSVGTPNAGVNFACAINSVKTVGGAAGSITVDIWKANAAIPASGNKISASAPATLSSAQINQAGSLAGWSTSVAVNDIFWASVATVDGALTNVTVQIGCQ